MPARKARVAPELSHATIQTRALALIDRDGLDAFSLRKLGAELGCEGMAIYWYYPSKDALLDAVVDVLMAEVAEVLVPDAGDWVGALRAVAVAYREIAHAHPRAFPLLATRRFGTETTFAFLERLFELGSKQGLDDKTTARYYRVVSSYCNGFALSELAAPRTTSALRKKFPRVAAVSAFLDEQHIDDVFTFGLELQLAAIARETKAARR